MENNKVTYQEFATKIKSKYPQYSDMDDLELANKIISKYPEYKETVDFGEGVTEGVNEGVKKKELGDSESLEEPTSLGVRTKGLVSTPRQEFLTLDAEQSMAEEEKAVREEYPLSFQEEHKSSVPDYMGLFNRKEDIKASDERGVSVSFYDEVAKNAARAEYPVEFIAEANHLKNKAELLVKHYPEAAAELSEVGIEDVNVTNIDEIREEFNAIQNKYNVPDMERMQPSMQFGTSGTVAVSPVGGLTEYDKEVDSSRAYLEAVKMLKEDNDRLLVATMDRLPTEKWGALRGTVGASNRISKGMRVGLKEYAEGYTDLLSDLKGNRAVNTVLTKLESEEPLTTDDKVLLKAIFDNSDLHKELDDEISRSYKIGESLGQSAGFMGEFVLTGGAVSGVGKGMLKQAAVRGVTSKAGKLGLNAAIKLAQTGIQTPLMPSMWQKTAVDISKGETPWKAVLNNAWQTAAETGSERIFLVNPVKGSGGALNGFMRSVGINFNVDKGAIGVLRNMGEEYLEEKVGEIMTAPKDHASFKSFWKSFTDKENNLVTLGSTSLMTGGMGSVAVAGNAISKAKHESRIAKLEKILPSDLRAEIDVIIGNKDLTVQQQYGLVADLISERIDMGELEENPSEIAANAIAYLNHKTQVNAAEATDKSVVVENGVPVIKVEEPVSDMQQQLDYLKSRGVEIPDGTTAEQLDNLYNVEQLREKQDGQEMQVSESERENVPEPEVETTEVKQGSETGKAEDEVAEVNRKSLDKAIKKSKYKVTVSETADVSMTELEKGKTAVGQSVDKLMQAIGTSNPQTGITINPKVALAYLNKLKEKYPNLDTEKTLDFIYEEVIKHESQHIDDAYGEFASTTKQKWAARDRKLTKESNDRVEAFVKAQETPPKPPITPVEPRSPEKGVEVPPVEKVGEMAFKTHTGEVVSGDRLMSALNRVADDWAKLQRAIRKEDKYAPHVTEEEKDNILAKGLETAEQIRRGEKSGEFWAWQRINEALTGESVPLFSDKESKPTEGGVSTLEEKKITQVTGIKPKNLRDKKRQQRFTEIDNELGNELENLAELLGGITKLTGEQRAKLLPTVVKVSKLLAEKYALKGQELIDNLVEYFRSKNIELDEEILKQVRDAEVKGTPLQGEGTETGQERRGSDSNLPEVDRTELQDGKEAEKAIKEKSNSGVKYPSGNIRESRAGVRYAFGENFSDKSKEAYRDNKLYEYVSESHEEVASIVQSIWDLNDIRTIENTFTNKDVPRRVRVGLGLLLARHYSNVADVNARDGNDAVADQYSDKATETFKTIQDEMAIDAGRDVSFFGSQFVTALLTPYGTAREVERQFNELRDKVEKSKAYKNTVKAIENDLYDLRKTVLDEINKQKKVQEAKKKYAEKKTVDPEKERIRNKRNNLIEKLREERKKYAGMSVVPFLTKPDIEIGTQIALTYIEEGIYDVKKLIRALKKDFKKLDLDITDEQARSLLPQNINGKTLEEIEKEQVIAEAATRLAQEEFGVVIDKKAPKSDPLNQMVKTLVTKFSERGTEKGEKPKPRKALDIIVEALVNKEQYLEVWKQAKDEAIALITKDKNLTDAQKKKYSKRVNDAYDNATSFSVSEKKVQQLLRETLKEKDITIDDVVRDHYERRELHKHELIRDLVEKSGLTDKDAKELADVIDNAFNTLLTQKGEALVKKYVKNKTVKRVSKGAKSPVAELIELVNIGAFESEEFRKIFGEMYGVPSLTKEQKEEIIRRGKKIQKIKSATKRHKEEQSLMSYIFTLHPIDPAEIFTALWYAHILAGISTQMRNIGDASISSLVEVLVAAGVRHKDAVNAINFYWKGLKGEGYLRAMEVLTTGYTPLAKRIEIPPVLEMIDFKAEDNSLVMKSIAAFANTYINILKVFPSRFMIATDSLLFVPAKEAFAYLAISSTERRNLEIAKGRRLNAQERKSLYSSVLSKFGITKEQISRIVQQVEQESEDYKDIQTEFGEKPTGYTDREKKLRLYELVDQERGIDVSDLAFDMAGRALGNIKTYGTLGAAVDMVAKLLRTFGVKIVSVVPKKIGGKVVWKVDPEKETIIKPGVFVMPFTQIVSNTITRNIGYTLVGSVVRASTGRYGNFIWDVKSPYRVEMSDFEKRKKWNKVALVVGFQALVYALMSVQDDDDPWFEVTFNGTGDYDKNQQIKGWSQYSIRFGEFSINYMNMGVIGAMLMPLGYMNDAKKYQQSKKSDLALFAEATIMTLPSLYKTSPLFGLTRVVDAMKYAMNADGKMAIKEFEKIAAGIGTGFVSPRTLQDIAEVLSLGKPDDVTETTMARIMQYVPFVGKVFTKGRIAIDVFGDPILTKMSVTNIMRKVEQDTNAKYYIEQGYLRPIPDMKNTAFEMWDSKGNLVVRELNPNNEKEVALFNAYEIMIGKAFKEKVIQYREEGLEGEEFVEKMQSAWLDIQRNAKREMKYTTEYSPVKYDDEAAVVGE